MTSVSVKALVFLRQPKSRTMSTRSVSRFSRIAPRKSGSWQSTVRQFPMVLAGCPFPSWKGFPALQQRSITHFRPAGLHALNSEFRCSMFLTSSREKHLICMQNQIPYRSISCFRCCCFFRFASRCALSCLDLFRKARMDSFAFF